MDNRLRNDLYSNIYTVNNDILNEISKGGNGGTGDGYSKSEADAMFVSKDERFQWDLREVTGRTPEANLNLLDNLKQTGRYALNFNEKGEALPAQEYGFLLVTQRSDTKDLRQEFSFIDPSFGTGKSTVYFAYRVYEHSSGKWSTWAALESNGGGSVDAYTKSEADTKFATKTKVDTLEGDIANLTHDLGLRPTEEDLDKKFATISSVKEIRDGVEEMGNAVSDALEEKVDKVPVIKFNVPRTISSQYIKDVAPPEYPQIAERKGNYIFATQSFRVAMGFPIGIGSTNPFFKIPVEHAPTMRRSCTLGVIIRNKVADTWSYMNLVGVILPDGSVLPMSPPNGSTMVPDDSIVSFQAEYTIAYNAEGKRPPDPVQGLVGDNIITDDMRALANDYIEMHEKVDVIYNGAGEVKNDVIALKDTIKDLQSRLSKLETP